MSEEQIADAVVRFQRAQAVAELKRRNPDADWRTDVPCPDCGGMEHFECDGRKA